MHFADGSSRASREREMKCEHVKQIEPGQARTAVRAIAAAYILGSGESSIDRSRSEETITQC
jgi:hypothetical protein